MTSLLFSLQRITLHYGITAHLCPWQGSVPILPPNSQKTLLRERLTNVIRICPLTLCQSYSRSSCFSKGGTVATIKLGRPDVSWNITLKKTVAIILCRFRFMWRKHPNFIETGITLIRSLWPNGVPLHLDAVYENVQRNVILFFKGKINELKVTSRVYVIYLRVKPKKSDCKKFFTSDLQICFSFLLQVSSIGCWGS